MNSNGKVFYSIKEVCERYQIKPSTLHYWEKVFPMLKPHRNKKGNRLYTEQDILLLDMIYFLVKIKGYTLKGAKEKLQQDRHKIEQKAFILQTLIRTKIFLQNLLHAIEQQEKHIHESRKNHRT